MKIYWAVIKYLGAQKQPDQEKTLLTDSSQMETPNIKQSRKIKLVMSCLHLEGTGINGKSTLKSLSQGTASEDIYSV